MGCGVSMPETEEGGDLKMKIQQGSSGKGSEVADSFILDKELLEMSLHSKKSKSNDEKMNKIGVKAEEEDEDEEEEEEEKGDRLIFSPDSPSFRIYCAFPRDPNDKNVIDDHELRHNKSIAKNNKNKGKRQEAVRTRMRKSFYNVKKKLTNYPSHSQPSSQSSQKLPL